MDIRYHINNEGKVAECGARQRKCRYGEQFVQPPVGRKMAEKVSMPNEPGEPSMIEIDSPLTLDFYEWYEETPNEYQSERRRLGEDVEVTAVDVRSFMARVYRMPEENIPQEVVEYAEAEGWDDPSRFSVRVESDYYDDTMHLRIADGPAFKRLLEGLRERF